VDETKYRNGSKPRLLTAQLDYQNVHPDAVLAYDAAARAVGCPEKANCKPRSDVAAARADRSPPGVESQVKTAMDELLGELETAAKFADESVAAPGQSLAPASSTEPASFSSTRTAAEAPARDVADPGALAAEVKRRGLVRLAIGGEVMSMRPVYLL
jgi:hypothetical protein